MRVFARRGRHIYIFLDSRLKISLGKKSLQIQAESSDFILNPEGVERVAKHRMRPSRQFPHQHLVQGDQLKITVEEPLEDLEGPLP